MNIQPYTSTYFKDCLQMLQGNIPDYFDPHEEADFIKFLLTNPQNYFVLIVDPKTETSKIENRDSYKAEVKACGGYSLNSDKTEAGLMWGMVKRDDHKLGFGTQLLEYRLTKLKTEHPNAVVMLDTSQHVYPFFERFGFVTSKITPKGFGPELDRYDMKLE